MIQEKYYLAYGSNLNLSQMAKRCPTAKVVGVAMLKGYRLTFCSVATIIPDEGAEVPVGVWGLQPDDELALDRYEGYPSLYRKEEIEVPVKGRQLRAMVYIMNSDDPRIPSESYYRTIEEGYDDVGLDVTYLREALDDTIKRVKKNKRG